MNSSCPICDEKILCDLLTKLDVEVAEQETCDGNSVASFVKTFSMIFDLSEESIKITIRNHFRDPAFNNLLKWEYGSNFMHFFDGNHRIANFAWIGAIAQEYGREIVVVCDFLCLNFAHKGLCAFVFQPSHIDSTRDPVGCVVFGANIYHPLKASEALKVIRDNHIYKRYNYQQNEINSDSDVEDLNRNDSDTRDVEFVEPQAAGRAQNPIIDVGTLAESVPDSNEPDLRNQRPHNSISIVEFLDTYFVGSNAELISQEAYTNSLKLDMKRSALDPESLNLNKTHDIDGIFGFFDPALYGKVINCPVKFMLFPKIVDLRTKKNIIKLWLIPEVTNMIALKIGQIEISLGKIDLIVCINTNATIDDSRIILIAEECANYARTLPCSADPLHLQNCASRAVRGSHRSTTRATTKYNEKNEMESYNALNAQCFVNHFMKALEPQLLRRGHRGSIKFFFKCIGSKSTTFTESIDDCLDSLKNFGAAINFNELDTENVWIDYCVTSSAECDNRPVSWLN